LAKKPKLMFMIFSAANNVVLRPIEICPCLH